MRVSLDRLEDLARTLELVDRILVATPYTPNDLWVRRLPLRDADARAIKDEIRDHAPYSSGEFEVPILKVYRYWIEGVVREYAPPPEKATYPSILDAVSGLTSRTPAVKAHWVAYRDATAVFADAVRAREELSDALAGTSDDERKQRAPELVDRERAVGAAQVAVDVAKRDLQRDAELLTADAQLDTEQRSTIAREAVTALSVAFRIELEALALAPIVAIQAVRALPNAPQELIANPSLKSLRQAWQLPSYVTSIKARIQKQVVVLEGMTSILAKALREDVDDTPGFALRESVVDQIVGITLDSFRVDLHAGGEAFIYSNVQTAAQQSSDNGKEKLDYRGRQFKLDYRVKPIVLASARFDLTFDAINLPNAGFLGFGYSTDRAFKSGGTIEQSSLTSQLGIHGAASDVIDFGLGILGIRSSVKVASFTAGEVRKVAATDVSQVVDKAPLQLQFTQVDVGYDVLWAVGDASAKAWMEELVVGVRFLKYTLPRILYELQNTSTDPNVKSFTFTRESPAQNVATQYYMAGFNARFGVGEAPMLSPYADVSMYGGAGPSDFYFLKNAAGGDVAANDETFPEAACGFKGGLGRGLRWRLLPRGSRARLDLRALYRADVIYSTIHRANADTGAERRTDFGGVDVFHGPTLALRGAF
ncbi:MAG: hypothetical protein NVS3B10_01460 [Polyangiales bacterium]